MATFLVTGGCGFIGSHLCAALRARGDVVRVLDDLSTGTRENLASGANLIEGSVTDPLTLEETMTGVDGCFHLAAIASVERCTQDWLGSHRTNLSGTIAVFDAARKAGRVPVVYASSAAVYGDCLELPLHESMPVRPLSAYGADKLGCELHALVAGVVHSVPTLGMRFFNVFGPRQAPDSPYSGVISIFCDKLSRGEPVVMHGDGGQTRDFIYVADVVSALLAAVDAATTTAPVLNVCTGKPTSILHLATTIAELCGCALELRTSSVRHGDIRHSIGSPDRSIRTLPRPAPMELSLGLARTLDWMRLGRPSLTPIEPRSIS